MPSTGMKKKSLSLDLMLDRPYSPADPTETEIALGTSRLSSLEKMMLESLEGSRSLSTLVSEIPYSFAFSKSDDRHSLLSGQILHRPKLC
jgi:hypothetical protein